MVDYSKGKIYKIVCNKTGKIYIGSTVSKLSKRLSQHKEKYKKYLNNTYHFLTSFEILKNDNFQIVLIENIPCNNKEELFRRERYYIENNKCVNQKIPIRENREYYELNKEVIDKYNKEYKIKNREKLKEKEKIYIEKNKEKILLRKRIYRINNLQKLTAPFICDCGVTIQYKNKSRHFKTKKHTAYIQSLNNIN